MTAYYLLLWMSRFHSDPRIGVTLLNAGPLLITPVKLVGFLAVLVAMFAARPDGAAVRLRNPIAWIFPVYVVVPVIVTLFAGQPTPSNPISSLLSFYLMLVATRLLVTTDQRAFKSVRVLTLASAVGSLWIYRQHFLQHIDRPTGLEQDPNYEALTLVTALPLAIWMTRHEAAAWYRRVGALSAGLMGAGVVITQSRAGIIALGIMALATVLYSRRKIVTLALIGAATMLVLVLAPATLTQRFESVKLSGNATNGDEESTRVHFELAKAGLAMTIAHPISGIGLDRFKAEALGYNPVIYSIAARAYIAHDTYIQIAAEEGLPLLILFLIMIGLALHNLSVVRRNADRALRDLATAMQVGVVGFCIAAISVTAEYIFPFWIIVFMSCNLREISESARTLTGSERQRALDVAAVSSLDFSSRPGRTAAACRSGTLRSHSIHARASAGRC